MHTQSLLMLCDAISLIVTLWSAGEPLSRAPPIFTLNLYVNLWRLHFLRCLNILLEEEKIEWMLRWSYTVRRMSARGRQIYTMATKNICSSCGGSGRAITSLIAIIIRHRYYTYLINSATIRLARVPLSTLLTAFSYVRIRKSRSSVSFRFRPPKKATTPKGGSSEKTDRKGSQFFALLTFSFSRCSFWKRAQKSAEIFTYARSVSLIWPYLGI